MSPHIRSSPVLINTLFNTYKLKTKNSSKNISVNCVKVKKIQNKSVADAVVQSTALCDSAQTVSYS